MEEHIDYVTPGVNPLKIRGFQKTRRDGFPLTLSSEDCVKQNELAGGKTKTTFDRSIKPEEKERKRSALGDLVSLYENSPGLPSPRNHSICFPVISPACVKGIVLSNGLSVETQACTGWQNYTTSQMAPSPFLETSLECGSLEEKFTAKKTWICSFKFCTVCI